MQRHLFVGLMSGLLLLGAGCASGEFAECFSRTPWDSCVNFDGVDEALIGQWTLTAQVLDTPVSRPNNPEGIVQNPFRGRTTTFVIDDLTDPVSGLTTRYGVFSEDYSTETGGDVDGGDLSTRCESMGTAGGSYRSEIDLDLDAYNPDEAETAPTIATLKIYPAGDDARVRCTQQNGGVITVESSGTSTPLGVGKHELDSRGAHIRYTYTISEDWQSMTLTHDNDISDVQTIFTFARIAP